MSNIPLETEVFFIIGQLIYYVRMYEQNRSSKKAKLSINTKLFWKLTIVSGVLMIIYGIKIGSITMPIANGITIIYAIKQHKIGAI